MKKLIALAVLTTIATTNIVAASELDAIFGLIDDEINEAVYNDYFINDTELLEELENAVDWGHSEWLTKFDDINEFEHRSPILREAASKFYAEFYEDFLGLENETGVEYSCTFFDKSTAHAGLLSSITKACELGLFKGDKGNFLPKQELTNGQALVVLIKALEGPKAKRDSGHWAEPYLERAHDLNLAHDLKAGEYKNLDMPATRWDIMVMMYRAAQELDMVND